MVKGSSLLRVALRRSGLAAQGLVTNVPVRVPVLGELTRPSESVTVRQWFGDVSRGTYAPVMASPAIRAERVVIVMAMRAEAAPLGDALDARPVAVPGWADSLPVQLFEAQPDRARPRVLLALNGIDPSCGVDCIGSTAAAITTQVALCAAADRFDGPSDLVLSVGTAGGWERHGTSIGDVYMAWDRFVSHDRRIDLPRFDEYGVGNHRAADLRSHAAALGCRLGIITTGDSLDESADDATRIAASAAQVKDMEAAAVAWIAGLHRVPVSAVKAITDLVDSPVATPEQFTENLTMAAARLQVTTLQLLERLAAQSNGGPR